MKRTLAGHLVTLAPVLRHAIRRQPVPAMERRQEWLIEDPTAGPVAVSGVFATPSREVSPGRLVVLQHGLGGSIDSPYMRAAARAALERGATVLRLNARGADLDLDHLDIPHAGFTDDLHAVLTSRALRPWEQIDLVGFSMGGHQVLRYGCETRRAATVRSVVAISPPLDLAATRARLDTRGRWIYRNHMLRSLKATWRAVRDNKPALPGASVHAAGRARTFDTWDARVVVPRHDFGSVAGYDAAACISRTIGDLDVRTLVVASPHDPMIPWAAGEATLRRAPVGALEHWRVERGGHVAFIPPRSRAPWRATAGEVVGRALDWCERDA